MISIAALRQRIEGDWVAFDKHGNKVAYDVPKDIGPATMSVSPVVDAIKRIDEADRVVESVPRESLWEVDAIVLNSVVLGRLDDRVLTAEELIEAVREAGFVWEISSTSAP